MPDDLPDAANLRAFADVLAVLVSDLTSLGLTATDAGVGAGWGGTAQLAAAVAANGVSGLVMQAAEGVQALVDALEEFASAMDAVVAAEDAGTFASVLGLVLSLPLLGLGAV